MLLSGLSSLTGYILGELDEAVHRFEFFDFILVVMIYRFGNL